MNTKDMEEGYCKGENCNRDDCEGIIDAHDRDGSCSCFNNPPCSYCTEPVSYCPKCEWEEREERDIYDDFQTKYWDEYHKRPEIIAERLKREEDEKLFYKMYRGDIPVEKYEARHRSHTHFSQVIFGVHPNMTSSEILPKVIGTFGGRFSKFNNYSFEYIAYTD